MFLFNCKRQGLLGSSVYICYKKSMNCPPLIRYTPTIIDRYPKHNLDCYALPESTALFCMPMGCTVECWTKECIDPGSTVSTFVLTSNTAVKVYGAAVNYYEPLDDEEVDIFNEKELRRLNYLDDSARSKQALRVKKSICILSRWPYITTFQKFLQFLHMTYGTGVNRLPNIPIETYVSFFMHDVPFPSIQRPRILVQLSSSSKDDLDLTYSTEEMPLPVSGASYSNLLLRLGVESCINLFLCALMEQKILLNSLDLNCLTSVAEAITSLIFPFHWQCPYIPLCPLVLCDVLNAPLPFIVGVDSTYFDTHSPPKDLVCISLDTFHIFMFETKSHLTPKLMPRQATKILRKQLETIYERMVDDLQLRQVDPQSRKLLDSAGIGEQKRKFDIQIQEAFLQFMAIILKDFRSYLKPITKAPTVGATDPKSLFNFAEFLKSREKSSQQFYSLLMNTQMFTKFIEERSFVSDKDTSLAFFDECLNKVENDCNFERSFQILDFDGRFKSDRTILIPPPEPLSPTNRFVNSARKNKRIGPFNHQLFSKSVSDEKTNKFDFFANESLPESAAAFSTDSPMSKRTKQEIRLAQTVAHRMASTSALTWTKCLVSYCYSLWFVHLPSFIKATEPLYPIQNQLDIAFSVLMRMQSLKLHPLDEVCYRVLMLLCGVYSKPVLAVKILYQMKVNGVRPNAITYGYYNRAVLESHWPTDCNAAVLAWAKLRNTFRGISEFKRLGRLHRRRLSKGDSELGTISASESSLSVSLQHEASEVAIGNALPDTHHPNHHHHSHHGTLSNKKTIVRMVSNEQCCTDELSAMAGLLMPGRVYLDAVSSGRLSDMKRNTRLEELFSGKSRVFEPTEKVQSKVGTWRSYSLGQKAIQKFREESLWPLKRELDSIANRLDEDDEIELDKGTDTITTDTVDSNSSRSSNKAESNEKIENENMTFTPIKDAFLNMNLFSPEGKVASTLRNSFRMAKSQFATNNLFKGQMPKSHTFQSEAEIGLTVKESRPLSRSKTEDQCESPLPIVRKSNLTRSSTMPPIIKPQGHERKASDCGLRKREPEVDEITSEESVDGEKNVGGDVNSIWSNKQRHISMLNSTFKSATNSMANRFSEIKTSLASNSASPARLTQNNISQVMENTSALLSTFATMVAERLPSNLNATFEDGSDVSFMNYQSSEVDGQKRSRENSLVPSGTMEEHNFYDTLELFHSKSLEHGATQVKLMFVQLTSCSRCHKCQAIVYDEEIMSAWSPDDSNLNTICNLCNEPFVPLITVEIRVSFTWTVQLDNVCHLKINLCFFIIKNAQYDEDGLTKMPSESPNHSIKSRFGDLKRESPFTVAYLSPIVLRKELENILENEGDVCLANSEFVTEHPIVYWNLVWYFERTNLPSHLPGLCISSTLNRLKSDNVNKLDHRNVTVECLWDNEKLHEDQRKPLFYLWRQIENSQQSKLIHALLTERTSDRQPQLRRLIDMIRRNDMPGALAHILHYQLQRKCADKSHYSIYRDLLFLSFAAIGRKNIDSSTLLNFFTFQFR
jgi:hypothetical protein